MGAQSRGKTLGRLAWAAGPWLAGQARGEFSSEAVLPGKGLEGCVPPGVGLWASGGGHHPWLCCLGL